MTGAVVMGAGAVLKALVPIRRTCQLDLQNLWYHMASPGLETPEPPNLSALSRDHAPFASPDMDRPSFKHIERLQHQLCCAAARIILPADDIIAQWFCDTDGGSR